ncbi:MAG: GNAT family N-acetyltransferase [candidate division Zixibacteria bacterium]|nr:GNAT family N-acetyltransferase [candidate division Zixibacteria bacterium]
MPNKSSFPKQLTTPRTIVRHTTPDDLKQIYNWPLYPKPFECFNVTDPVSQSPNGKFWWERIEAPDRNQYSVILPDTREVIGLHAFVNIDWEKRAVGNMAIRIRADLCNKKYGMESLKPLLKAVLSTGMVCIRLDVAATNIRAVNCYENCGMKIIDEFWRKHEGEPIDPNNSIYASLIKHLKQEGDDWFVRFYWMEISR